MKKSMARALQPLIFCSLAATGCQAAESGDDTPVADAAMLEQPTDAEQPAPEASLSTVKLLDVNDVTFLFPLPKAPEDLDRLIRPSDLRSSAGEPVFPPADFDQMITLAESPVSAVGRHQIKLTDPMRPIEAWFIAGVRVDPTAPGSLPELQAAFGRRPQIRLVVQPVTSNGGSITVHDTALHVIYDYITGLAPGTPGSVPQTLPDDAVVQAIVAELVQLRDLCEAAGVATSGTLSVHPCLAQPETREAFGDGVRTLLEAYLAPARFNSGAIMGLANQNPEPWIFVAMNRDPASGDFQPLPSPGLGSAVAPLTAQMLSFVDNDNVQPAPSTTNRNSLTASLVIPREQRRGVSTAPLFAPPSDLADKATVGVDGSDAAVQDASLTVGDIADWIANPRRSHFFNTDCVSCHTETTRQAILQIPPSPEAFELPDGVSGLDPAVSPVDQWNVRNLGWFRGEETITRRTANETAEVVEWINTQILAAE